MWQALRIARGFATVSNRPQRHGRSHIGVLRPNPLRGSCVSKRSCCGAVRIWKNFKYESSTRALSPPLRLVANFRHESSTQSTIIRSSGSNVASVKYYLLGEVHSRVLARKSQLSRVNVVPEVHSRSSGSKGASCSAQVALCKVRFASCSAQVDLC